MADGITIIDNHIDVLYKADTGVLLQSVNAEFLYSEDDILPDEPAEPVASKSIAAKMFTLGIMTRWPRQ